MDMDERDQVTSGAELGAAGPPRGGGGAGPLPGPPPLNTPAAMLAMARAGVKLTREQLKGLSGSDRKAAKKARKETKKVGSGAG